MVRWIFLALAVTLWAENGIVGYTSRYGVEETGRRLVKTLREQGIHLYSVIDHADAARSVGKTLPPMKLFVFGDPSMEEALVHCAPTLGLDLPMKMLIYREENGTVRVVYDAPLYLYWRHRVPVGCEHKIQKRLGPLIDALAKTAAGVP